MADRREGVYPAQERAADRVVHLTGVAAGLVAVPTLVVDAFLGPSRPLIQVAVAAYRTCLVAMLSCSAAYNLTPVSSVLREAFRRADRAAIFAMVAATCAVLLTCSMAPGWLPAAVAAVWTLALGGVVAAVAFPRRFELVELAACLALGWGTTALLLLAPAARPLDAKATWLLVAGGGVYTGGAAVHLWHALPYQNALWHALVLVATALHFAAVTRVVG